MPTIKQLDIKKKIVFNAMKEAEVRAQKYRPISSRFLKDFYKFGSSVTFQEFDQVEEARKNVEDFMNKQHDTYEQEVKNDPNFEHATPGQINYEVEEKIKNDKEYIKANRQYEQMKNEFNAKVHAYDNINIPAVSSNYKHVMDKLASNAREYYVTKGLIDLYREELKAHNELKNDPNVSQAVIKKSSENLYEYRQEMVKKGVYSQLIEQCMDEKFDEKLLNAYVSLNKEELAPLTQEITDKLNEHPMVVNGKQVKAVSLFNDGHTEDYFRRNMFDIAKQDAKIGAKPLSAGMYEKAKPFEVNEINMPSQLKEYALLRRIPDVPQAPENPYFELGSDGKLVSKPVPNGFFSGIFFRIGRYFNRNVAANFNREVDDRNEIIRDNEERKASNKQLVLENQKLMNIQSNAEKKELGVNEKTMVKTVDELGHEKFVEQDNNLETLDFTKGNDNLSPEDYNKLMNEAYEQTNKYYKEHVLGAEQKYNKAILNFNSVTYEFESNKDIKDLHAERNKLNLQLNSMEADPVQDKEDEIKYLSDTQNMDFDSMKVTDPVDEIVEEMRNSSVSVEKEVDEPTVNSLEAID